MMVKGTTFFQIPRAAPKKRLGFSSALASTPPVNTLPEGWHHGVVGTGQTGDGVEQNHHVAFVFDQALWLFSMTISGNLHVP